MGVFWGGRGGFGTCVARCSTPNTWMQPPLGCASSRGAAPLLSTPLGGRAAGVDDVGLAGCWRQHRSKVLHWILLKRRLWLLGFTGIDGACILPATSAKLSREGLAAAEAMSLESAGCSAGFWCAQEGR